MTVSLESLRYLDEADARNERAETRLDPRQELLENPDLRRHYFTFVANHGDTIDQNTAVVAHGITTAGEVVLARQQDHNFEVATFSMNTYETTKFTYIEPTLIGDGDQTRVYLRAYEGRDQSGRRAELLLTRDQDGNEWRSDRQESSEHLRDMRLITAHLAHLAEDGQNYTHDPAHDALKKTYGHHAVTHLVVVK